LKHGFEGVDVGGVARKDFVRHRVSVPPFRHP
jgi:hypothetical protein